MSILSDGPFPSWMCEWWNSWWQSSLDSLWTHQLPRFSLCEKVRKIACMFKNHIQCTLILAWHDCSRALWIFSTDFPVLGQTNQMAAPSLKSKVHSAPVVVKHCTMTQTHPHGNDTPPPKKDQNEAPLTKMKQAVSLWTIALVITSWCSVDCPGHCLMDFAVLLDLCCGGFAYQIVDGIFCKERRSLYQLACLGATQKRYKLGGDELLWLNFSVWGPDFCPVLQCWVCTMNRMARYISLYSMCFATMLLQV